MQEKYNCYEFMKTNEFLFSVGAVACFCLRVKKISRTFMQFKITLQYCNFFFCPCLLFAEHHVSACQVHVNSQYGLFWLNNWLINGVRRRTCLCNNFFLEKLLLNISIRMGIRLWNLLDEILEIYPQSKIFDCHQYQLP